MFSSAVKERPRPWESMWKDCGSFPCWSLPLLRRHVCPFWASLDLWALSVPHVTKKLLGQDHRFTIPVYAPVLRGASLELKQGTTLFKNILGINTPADGSIRFNGENLLKMPRRERERRIAYVPQDIHFGALSVLIPSLWPGVLFRPEGQPGGLPCGGKNREGHGFGELCPTECKRTVRR